MKRERGPISSLAEYVALLGEITEEWSDPKLGDITLWCRGHANADWSLVPGEFRWPGLNIEEVFSEFHLKARPLLRESPQSEWEWYFLMQHHGLPTRLLDWTAGGLLALYFALREQPGEHDSAVWVLDPWALNKMATGKNELFLCSDPEIRDYSPGTGRKAKTLPNHPIAIVPPYNSARITVQRGAFTIHGGTLKGLEAFRIKRLAKILIAKSSAIQMRRELRLAGVGEFTLFPDLDGLCREICAVQLLGC